MDLATLIILMKKEFLLLRKKISENREKGIGLWMGRGGGGRAVKNSLSGGYVM